MVLVNARNDVTIASDVNLALTRAERRKGLLGRDSLDPSAALVISPCSSIHTMFMRFPIDVIFLDRDNRVVKVITAMKPWRTALGGRGAQSALELEAGALEANGLQPGDVIALSDG